MTRRAWPAAGLIALALACTHARTAASPTQEERATQREEAKSDDAREKARDGERKDDGDGHDGNGHDGKDGSDAHGAGKERRGAPAARSGDASEGASDTRHEQSEQAHKDHEAARDIEVATSPQGLLKPGAQDKVREKLGLAKGDGTREALRRFQREHDLPATGMLDHETVERLGLAPDDIFEK